MPLVTHGLTLDVGGLEPIDDGYLDELTRFVRRVASPFHSDHLCFGGVGGAMLHDLLPLPFTREAAAHAARRAREVEARVGVPLMLENITHYFVPGAPEMSEAAFIREVLDASGARLLLDVNNAWVNAQNYGFDARAFLLDLPLDRVVQIHVAGHVASPDEGILVDSHGADCVDPVLDLLAWTVERTGPVPVVLERDHAVPAYDALLEELARVSAAVDAGLCAARPLRVAAGRGAAMTTPRLDALLGAVQRVVREPDAAARLTADARGFLREGGLEGADVHATAAFGAKRLLVYRRLVRGGVASAIRTQMPRAAARLGDRFDRLVDAFFEARAPRSRYLRDVPFEFLDFASPAIARDAAVPAFVLELARHELSVYASGSAPDAPPGARRGAGDLALDRGAVFDPSVRLARYAFAVHELSEDPDARDTPRSADTRLLAYRDGDDIVRFLSLSPLAAEAVQRLLDGATLREAIEAACVVAGVALDDAVLAGAGAVLEDLGARGALLGAAP